MTARTFIRTLIVLICLAGIGYGIWYGVAARTVTTQVALDTASSPGLKTATFLHTPADLVTPLGGGYLFVNLATHGLNYAAANGTITDVSSRFNLAQSPTDPSNPTYNTVLDITTLSDSRVLVTTTTTVYVVGGTINQITALPASDDNFLNFTSSAYDNQTNSVFLLSGLDTTVYRYDLNNLTGQPSDFYTLPLQANRLAASGGKLVAYYDAVPTTETDVLAAYAVKRQLNPLVINTQTGKLMSTLKDYQAVTYASVSGDGRYIALKQKLATTLDVYDTSGHKVSQLPSYDTAGIAWQGSTLYLARDNAVWSYDATNQKGSLTKVASVNAPVIRLSLAGSQPIVSTNAGDTSVLLPLSQTTGLPATATRVQDAASSQAYIYGVTSN